MAIKKRSASQKATYTKFREDHWANQPLPDKINFRSGKMSDGSALTQVVLQPRKSLFLKDIWFCSSVEEALGLAESIAALKDTSVTYLLVDLKWVYVGFGHAPDLPGQETDKRDRITG